MAWANIFGKTAHLMMVNTLKTKNKAWENLFSKQGTSTKDNGKMENKEDLDC